LGHSIKDNEHNDWVLNVFHMGKIPEPTLVKMVIASRPVTEADATTTEDGAAAAAKKPR
jgi:hypothetical protein